MMISVAWRRCSRRRSTLAPESAGLRSCPHMEVSYEGARCAQRSVFACFANFDAGIVEDLRSRVFDHIAEAMGLEGVDAMLAGALRVGRRHSPWRRSFQADAPTSRTRRSSCWGSSDRLLEIAENYLACPSGTTGSMSSSTEGGRNGGRGRRWHRDIEDRRTPKIALDPDDVDEDGALQMPRRWLPVS